MTKIEEMLDRTDRVIEWNGLRGIGKTQWLVRSALSFVDSPRTMLFLVPMSHFIPDVVGKFTMYSDTSFRYISESAKAKSAKLEFPSGAEILLTTFEDAPEVSADPILIDDYDLATKEELSRIESLLDSSTVTIRIASTNWG